MLLGLIAAVPLAAQTNEQASGLTLKSVRLYRGDGTTRVKVFVEIPQRLFTRAPDGNLHYRMAVVVRDSGGQALMDEQWRQSMIPLEGIATASSVELLEFAVAPGAYTLAVTVRDSITGDEQRDSLTVEGFAGRPVVSDIVLSRSIRAATTADSMPGGSDWRHGNLVITTSPYLRLDVNKPDLYYLVEAYSSKPDSATVDAQVVNESGQALVRTRAQRLGVEEDGSVLTGRLPLAGLPQGEYLLRLHVVLGEREATREEPFTVRVLEAAPRPVAGRSPNSDEAFFGEMSDAQLDSAQAPLVYIADPGELSAYKRDLSTAAKARFLVAFWHKRDPTPEHPDNPRRAQFYRAIVEADRLYREAGRTQTPGWRSDRGRVFLRFGPPDEIWRRPEEGKTPPLEVWRYTKSRNRHFVFADRNRLGAYYLVLSNEVTEQGRADWADMLGYYGVQALENYLNVDLGVRALQ